MILKHIRLNTAWNRFYHAMIIKKEDESEPNFYASVFITWDEDSTGNSKYKTHFRGRSEQDVLNNLKQYLADQDKTSIDNIKYREYL